MTGRALVTGATGMLGSYIAERLREDGWSVRALVRSRERGAWLEGIGAELVDGCLDDVVLLKAAAESCDAVFHAAAAIGAGGDWEEYRRGKRGRDPECRRGGVPGRRPARAREQHSGLRSCSVQRRAHGRTRSASGAARPRRVWALQAGGRGGRPQRSSDGTRLGVGRPSFGHVRLSGPTVRAADGAGARGRVSPPHQGGAHDAPLWSTHATWQRRPYSRRRWRPLGERHSSSRTTSRSPSRT